VSGVRLTRHIISNNDRSHVIYWIITTQGLIRRCSEPNCEVNSSGLQAIPALDAAPLIRHT